MEDDIAVFTDQQLDIFGFPDETKYPRYMVIEGPPVYVQSFIEMDHSTVRKIHRYDRSARFRSVVKSMFGYSRMKADAFPFLPWIVQHVPDDERRYEATRKIMKEFGFARMYREIPTILRLAGKSPVIVTECPTEIIELLCDDFKHFQHKYWAYADLRANRRYMLNMKFLAIKFLERRGIVPQMPKLRTTPKIKLLTDVFEVIINK